MGIRGRPSLKSTDYSTLNYKRIFELEKKSLLLDLLSKAPRGMTVKEISEKFISSKPLIKRFLNDLIKEGKLTGPYHCLYFHNKLMLKK